MGSVLTTLVSSLGTLIFLVSIKQNAKWLQRSKVMGRKESPISVCEFLCSEHGFKIYLCQSAIVKSRKLAHGNMEGVVERKTGQLSKIIMLLSQRCT